MTLEAESCNALETAESGKQERQIPLLMTAGPIDCSWQFAKARAKDIEESVARRP